MKYVWLSYLLDKSTPSYGGTLKLEVEPIKRISNGDSCNASIWHLPNHLGTHVDLPNHFFDEGDTVDVYNPDFWIFNKISIVNVSITTGDILISPKEVTPFIKEGSDLVLLKTDMGKYRSEIKYWQENPGLSAELASELRISFPSVRALGIDFISISSWQNRGAGRSAHQEFLNPSGPGRPIVLIEDMDLSGITSKLIVSKVTIFPLRVINGNGAPCTVIAEVSIND